jgi:hypothetical protein
MMMVEMIDPDAATHIVKDVLPGEGTWRWTGHQPTFKILAYTTQNLKLSMDFALWDEGFKQTGPVELSFFVNQRLLDKVRYTKPGEQHFEKAVPAEWLSTDVESIVSVAVDKMYVGPTDGKEFGFILTKIGFVP